MKKKVSKYSGYVHRQLLTNLFMRIIHKQLLSPITSQGIEQYKMGKDDMDKTNNAIGLPKETTSTNTKMKPEISESLSKEKVEALYRSSWRNK